MSNVASKEKSKIFETVLSSPGMTEKCQDRFTTKQAKYPVVKPLIEQGC
jgi:hypothetical protein